MFITWKQCELSTGPAVQDVEDALSPSVFGYLSLIFQGSHFQLQGGPAVDLDLTRLPTLLVKVDHAAVGSAPGAQEHGSSFGDVGLAGVGFRGADQNADAGRPREKQNLLRRDDGPRRGNVQGLTKKHLS